MSAPESDEPKEAEKTAIWKLVESVEVATGNHSISSQVRKSAAPLVEVSELVEVLNEDDKQGLQAILDYFATAEADFLLSAHRAAGLLRGVECYLAHTLPRELRSIKKKHKDSATRLERVLREAQFLCGTGHMRTSAPRDNKAGLAAREDIARWVNASSRFVVRGWRRSLHRAIREMYFRNIKAWSIERWGRIAFVAGFITVGFGLIQSSLPTDRSPWWITLILIPLLFMPLQFFAEREFHTFWWNKKIERLLRRVDFLFVAIVVSEIALATGQYKYKRLKKSSVDDTPRGE